MSESPKPVSRMDSLVYRAGLNSLPLQHQLCVVAVHLGQAPVAPPLGRKQALQWPPHARDQEQLQRGNQHGLRNLAQGANRLSNVLLVHGRGYGVGGEPIDGCVPKPGQ